MEDIISHGYAERVSKGNTARPGSVSYIPHHGVYNDNKPGKIRVVFDCSAKYDNISLNDMLLQRPDMMNALLGVLCRFRKEPVAITCDVVKMFYQFKVDTNHRDFLRFLWWEKGDFTTEPVEYRMTVHLFGAISSPGCANFGMKKAADDGQEEFGSAAADFIYDDFYVDDGLTSLPTVHEAPGLLVKTQQICAKHGLRLHKFASNSKTLLMSIPAEDLSVNLHNIEYVVGSNMNEKALGVEWSIEQDTFHFSSSFNNCIVNSRPLSVNDLYDSSSTEQLTPNHILTMKTKIVLPPPGEFQLAGVYSRNRWRRVQHMLNVFWSRWENEYLQTLQMRSKWN